MVIWLEIWLRATRRGEAGQKMIAGCRSLYVARDVIRHLILVKATASLETRGYHCAKREGQGHSKKREWLPSGRVGKLKKGQQILGTIRRKG